jgi:hypothetical protein
MSITIIIHIITIHIIFIITIIITTIDIFLIIIIINHFLLIFYNSNYLFNHILNLLIFIISQIYFLSGNIMAELLFKNYPI